MQDEHGLGYLPRDCQDAPLIDTHLQYTNVPTFAVA